MDHPGATVITGIKGISLSPEEREFIQGEKVGGVVFFSHNFEDPAQLAELVNSIQTLRDEWPLFTAVDHEGGRVVRFKKGFTQFPAMYDLARLNSPKITYEAHMVMARELAACGVNLDFSPVCDVWTNPSNKVVGDRAFGNSPDEVEKHVSAAIRGLQTHGVLACAKHFPGHGDTLRDSHVDLPLIKDPLDALRARELQPFIKASKARVEFMMMAHLQVDALDEKLPTSLSPHAYAFLREETKFQKIIVTDDMQMRALTDRWSTEEAAVMASGAGADMLLYRDAEEAMKAVGALREALKTKTIKKDEFQAKLARIEACKSTHFKDYKPIYVPKISGAFNSVEGRSVLAAYQSYMDGKKNRG